MIERLQKTGHLYPMRIGYLARYRFIEELVVQETDHIVMHLSPDSKPLLEWVNMSLRIDDGSPSFLSGLGVLQKIGVIGHRACVRFTQEHNISIRAVKQSVDAVIHTMSHDDTNAVFFSLGER